MRCTLWQGTMELKGLGIPCRAESTEWFIEDQAFLLSFDSASHPPPPPLYPLQAACYLSFLVFMCVACRAYWRERGRGRSWARNQNIPPVETLALYKSFKTRCCRECTLSQKGERKLKVRHRRKSSKIMYLSPYQHFVNRSLAVILYSFQLHDPVSEPYSECGSEYGSRCWRLEVTKENLSKMYFFNFFRFFLVKRTLTFLQLKTVQNYANIKRRFKFSWLQNATL